VHHQAQGKSNATNVTGLLLLATGRWPLRTMHWLATGSNICGSCVCAVQLILGFVRPTATAPTKHRHIWDVAHSTLGRAAMLIGLANVGLGIFIFCYTYNGDFAMWAGLCAAGLCALSLLQYITDRQEKYAVLRNDRDMLLKAHEDDGFDGDGDVNGRDVSAPSSPHKPFPGNVHEQSLGSPSEAYPAAAAAGYGYNSGSQSRYHHQDDVARPGGAVSGSGVIDAGRNVKLTANLLQQHQASSGGAPSAAPGSAGQNLSQPGFAGFDLQPGGGGDHVEWDQGQGWQQQQQQYMLQQQQQQQYMQQQQMQVQQMTQQQLLQQQMHLQQQQQQQQQHQQMQQQWPGNVNLG
jgi:hypothetical protein